MKIAAFSDQRIQQGHYQQHGRDIPGYAVNRAQLVCDGQIGEGQKTGNVSEGGNSQIVKRADTAGSKTEGNETYRKADDVSRQKRLDFLPEEDSGFLGQVVTFTAFSESGQRHQKPGQDEEEIDCQSASPKQTVNS